MDRTEVPTPTSRSRRGRWIGGVCAGLATRWNVPVARVRLACVIGSLLLGLGLVVYLAAWLILPAEGDTDNSLGTGARAIVQIAQVCGALLGLAALGGAATVATVFGFGWVVFALAAALLVGTLVSWPRVKPAWVLLPIGALALPSVAMAASGVAIDPQMAPVTLAPRTVAELPDAPVRNGLGLIEVDLRETQWPASGRIPLRIEAGVRRTLVALPADRCVRVEVRQRAVPVATRVAGAMVGFADAGGNDGLAATPGAQVFGALGYDDLITAPVRAARRPAPTLVIDYASDGGQLVVRDYPDEVDPSVEPDWPGYPVTVEPRPHTADLSRRETREQLRDWRARRPAQIRSQRRIERLLPGPCVRAQDRR